MAEYIIGTEDFTKRLDSWLLRSKQEDAEFLHRNKMKIPEMFRKHMKPLYRGMFVTQDFISQLENKPVVFNQHSSWTKDKAIALKFIRDEKFKTENKGNIPLLLTMNITKQDQIIDIDSFVMFMGVQQLEMLGYDEINLDSASKEKEVLVSKGIRVKKQNAEIIT